MPGGKWRHRVAWASTLSILLSAGFAAQTPPHGPADGNTAQVAAELVAVAKVVAALNGNREANSLAAGHGYRGSLRPAFLATARLR